MYVLITAAIIAVSVPLLLITNAAYRKTVIEPYTKNLESIEIDQDRLTPSLNRVLDTVSSDAYRQILAENDSIKLIDFLISQPADNVEQTNEAEKTTLLDDVSEIIMKADSLYSDLNANHVFIEAVREGTVYRMASVIADNDEQELTGRLGTVGSYLDLSPEDYTSPTDRLIKDRRLKIRCIAFPLNNGECRIWADYDITDVMKEYHSYLNRCILAVLLLSVLVCEICLFLVRRFAIRPIRQLTLAARDFQPEEDGTYSAEKISATSVRTHDELQDLDRSIRSMQDEIVKNTIHLARMTAERERINTELNLATTIQHSALPSAHRPFPDRTEFDLFASMDPAREVGGDFYDFFLIDDDHLALVIADVSGKGVPAALFMMTSMSMIRNQLRTSSDPAAALRQVNAQLCERNPSKTFVTVWAAVLELSTGKTVDCNAGHENPLYRRSGEHFEFVAHRHAPVIGFLKSIRYQSREFIMRPGDCLFVYTDGIPEADDPSGAMFGADRMLETINSNPDASPEELARRMRESVASFTGDAEQSDDITILCLQYNGCP